MNPLSMIGNSVGGIFETLFGGKKRLAAQQQAEADAINPVDATYAISPESQQQLGLAQQLENGRAAGAATDQNNIFTNQANTIGETNRNATSGAQALSVDAATQGATNNAFSNLQTEEEKSKLSLVDNLNNAQNNMSNQEMEVYKDKLRKYNNDIAAKAALNSASIQNKMSWGNDLASTVGSFFGGSTSQTPAATGQVSSQSNLMTLLQSLFAKSGLTNSLATGAGAGI